MKTQMLGKAVIPPSRHPQGCEAPLWSSSNSRYVVPLHGGASEGCGYRIGHWRCLRQSSGRPRASGREHLGLVLLKSIELVHELCECVLDSPTEFSLVSIHGRLNILEASFNVNGRGPCRLRRRWRRCHGWHKTTIPGGRFGDDFCCGILLGRHFERRECRRGWSGDDEREPRVVGGP